MSDSQTPSYDDLVGLVSEQAATISLLREENAFLREELERLRKDPPSGVARAVPSYIKPNRPPREKTERKKRSRSFVRHREEPTRVVEHSVENCPDCGRKLSGGWVHRARQVIEIPQVRYQVTEHQMLRRWCGVCK